jgi:uncharacterized repeat protein (TIGR03803 family)
MKGSVSFTLGAGSGPLRAISPVLAALILFVLAPVAGQAQSYSVVYSFQCDPNGDGATPQGDLIADSAGNLYGTTSSGGIYGYGAVFEVSSDGTETILHSFADSPDGAHPRAGLVMGPAGNLYGTTSEGGLQHGGTVFEISSSETESIIYNFTSGKDEGEPYGNLLLDSNGNLYGTTTGQDDPEIYYGTAFKLSASDKIMELHTFAGAPDDGALPASGLVHDRAGSLYGTTLEGGAYEVGTVFELPRAGAESILYNFTGGSDGANPVANLLLDPAGNLYGTASSGGNDSGVCAQFFGCGTVFKLTPTGEETVLYTFTGGADGGFPLSDLLMDSKGDLYGTTPGGGSPASSCSTQAYPGCGVVFELTAAGKEKVLHTFTGYPNDGAGPYGGLVRVGNYLYGTTTSGGSSGDECGTVYKVAP